MLAKSMLEADLLSIFATPSNEASVAAMKFAKAVESYIRLSMPVIGGVVTVTGMGGILMPRALEVFSSPKNEPYKAAGLIAQGIMEGAMTTVYTGPCFGTGNITVYDAGTLKSLLTQVWSGAYMDPAIPAMLVANAIHTVSLMAVATGSGVPPHCPGQKVCTII